MQKLRCILGLPVLELKSGTQIGEAKEVVLDIEKALVAVVVVSGANWFSEAQGIYLQDIRSFGRDAIMVRDNEVIQELSDLHEKAGVFCSKELLDKQIITEAGLSLGTLVDVFFDLTTGEIKGYELSDGIVTDLLQGRMIMPMPQAQVVSGDKLIVPETMARLLHAEM